MDVTEALAQTRVRLAELQRRSRAARDQYIQLEVEVKQAQAEEAVLRRIAQRYEIPVAAQESPLPDEVREWQQLERTKAILNVLQEAAVPLSPKQIVRALQDKGRDDGNHAVSAALAHLKRQGRVRQEERGWWTTQVSAADEPPGHAPGVAEPDNAKVPSAPEEPDSGEPQMTGMDLIQRTLGHRD